MNEITQALRRVRRRMDAQSFLEKLTACALAAGVGFSALLAWRLFSGRPAPGVSEVLGISALALAGALIWTAARRASLHETAERIDALAQTRDRFITALSFSQRADADPSALERCALAECRGFAAAFDPQPFTRLRVPRRAAWLLAPALACALVIATAHFFHEKNRPDPAASELLAEKAGALETLAKQVDKANETEKSDELKKLAEELRKSEARLREDARPDEDANKTALRELSTLEEKIDRMRTPEELAALATELQKMPSAKNAADALRRGDLAGAAEELEKLAREAAGQSPAEREKLARALQEALARAQANRQGQLAQAMNDAANMSDAQQALQRLAEALRQAAAQRRSGAGAQSRALQGALAALQAMKLGRPVGDASDSAAGADGRAADQRVAIQNFQNGKPQAALAIDPAAPSGQAGSEHDTGTTKTPFGAPQKRAESDSPASDLAGVLGHGESLQSLVTTHGDTAKSAQRYRTLYDAMAPAAEDALEQENIPPGSRFFVKRYFEKIRPKE